MERKWKYLFGVARQRHGISSLCKKEKGNLCLKRGNVKENQANRWNELRFCVIYTEQMFLTSGSNETF